MEDLQTQNNIPEDNTPEAPQERASEETIIDPQTLLRVGLLGIVLVIIVYTFGERALPRFFSTAAVVVSDTQIEEAIDPFTLINIEASAAYVYDFSNDEVLFAKNESAQLPLASLTKVMTALVASEKVSADTAIVLSDKSIAVDGDSGLKAGEVWNFKDLLDYTLVVSSNDGAHAIAGVAGSFERSTQANEKDSHAAFVELMNATAQELGLLQTYFINESGLDTNTEVSGGYGSAQDMATLLSFVVSERPHLLEATSFNTLQFASEDGFIYNATNTNAAIGVIPGIIASKTGYTELAGGNLMVAFDAGINRPIVAIVLGSSFDGRFSDMEQLVNATLTKIIQ
ncbi:MAG: serine hydrolase [Candidatus Pacebacteria bacterium]|nr:serine hydrolase [Candidatus Paceibacterota bacterium]